MSGLHALYVITGKEKLVTEWLRRSGIKAMTPCEWRLERRRGAYHSVLHMVMPGYVFIETACMDANTYYAVKAIPHVIKLLNYPHPLPEDEAMYIRSILNGGEPIPCPAICLDHAGGITIRDGVLQDCEHKIVKLNKRARRVTYEITVNGQTERMSLSADFSGCATGITHTSRGG